MFVVLMASLLLGSASPSPIGMTRVHTPVVDDRVTGYATFQSHNQKVVCRGREIIAAYVRSRNAAYTAQEWRIVRSADGGASWSILRSGTSGTNPPVLEVDGAGRLFVGWVEFGDGTASITRLGRGASPGESGVTRVPSGAAGKYCMLLDERRGRIYWFAHNGTFAAIALDGRLLFAHVLLRDGPDAALQYPSLALADNGALHAAWTTVRHGVYLYWDIHHMVSMDGGRTWRTPAGSQIEPPIIADQHGPTNRITLDDEFDVHTWLSSFLVRDGVLHFAYLAQTSPPRQHYVRCDAQTGVRLQDLQPRFGGRSITLQGLDGFFASRRSNREYPLYYVGQMGGRIGCLASDDNGRTWYDYALGDETFRPYAIGGCREVSPDGYIVGTFTDMRDTMEGQANTLRLIRIRAGLCSARLVGASHDNRAATLRFASAHGRLSKVRVRSGGRWTSWAPFRTECTIRCPLPPTHYQLRSRSGVVADPVPVAERGDQARAKRKSRNTAS